MLLTDFQKIRPAFESSQEETLSWLIDAHTKAENQEGFKEAFAERLLHVGCKPEHIEKRGHVLKDFLHRNWEKMEVYNLSESPFGHNLSTRAAIYTKEVDAIFEKFYEKEIIAPDDLIHVSCTGYVSPSGAQKLVSQKNWGENTTVTHCYHMGCYASLPAIRMARGFLTSEPTKKRVDIVHTEICSLHSNPQKHELDQLVSQSLFADGFIKYSISQKATNPHLKVLSIREEIIPNSTSAMSWDVKHWGFQMGLSKEVPVFITRHLKGYLERLKATVSEKTLFAIHPGGPKILQYVKKLLNLSDAQIAFSTQILKNYGNMSSATLPHIWQKIVESEQVADGTKIVSLAFGPGLSISGSFMEKVCGSSV